LSAAFSIKSGAKTFGGAGPWPLSAPTPMAQHQQSFFASFCSQKEAFPFACLL
jgi:hypothetical protein